MFPLNIYLLDIILFSSFEKLITISPGGADSVPFQYEDYCVVVSLCGFSHWEEV